MPYINLQVCEISTTLKEHLIAENRNWFQEVYCQAIEKCCTAALEPFNTFFTDNSGLFSKRYNALYIKTVFLQRRYVSLRITEKLFQVLESLWMEGDPLDHRCKEMGPKRSPCDWKTLFIKHCSPGSHVSYCDTSAGFFEMRAVFSVCSESCTVCIMRRLFHSHHVPIYCFHSSVEWVQQLFHHEAYKDLHV